MRPVKSKLQLEKYFVSELMCQANVSYDPSHPMLIELDDIDVDSVVMKSSDTENVWQIALTVVHQCETVSQSPYSFRIKVVGFFKMCEFDDSDDMIVRANGSSVLFSIAREALRKAMQDGPWSPIVLPTVSFFDN